ncbi:MAG: hypothetical protein ACRDZO_17550 [Egibacteraceae bacterium]
MTSSSSSWSTTSPHPWQRIHRRYKTIRSLLTTAALTRGAASLHAAAMAIGDGVLAFCGAKGSGKSSVLHHLFLWRIPDLGYVANDRILLRTRSLRSRISVPSIPCLPAEHPRSALRRPRV